MPCCSRVWVSGRMEFERVEHDIGSTKVGCCQCQVSPHSSPLLLGAVDARRGLGLPQRKQRSCVLPTPSSHLPTPKRARTAPCLFRRSGWGPLGTRVSSAC